MRLHTRGHTYPYTCTHTKVSISFIFKASSNYGPDEFHWQFHFGVCSSQSPWTGVFIFLSCAHLIGKPLLALPRVGVWHEISERLLSGFSSHFILIFSVQKAKNFLHISFSCKICRDYLTWRWALPCFLSVLLPLCGSFHPVLYVKLWLFDLFGDSGVTMCRTLLPGLQR